MSKKILIIQTSPCRIKNIGTCSTILVNALYGMIEELHEKNIIGFYTATNKQSITDNIKIIEENFKNVAVIKYHEHNINLLTKMYGDKYELFFICSQRPSCNLFIEKKYKSYKNVVIFNYIELNETNENTLQNILDNIYNRLYRLFSNCVFIKLNKEIAINRITNMNKRYEEIKHLPFSYIDPFFEIHGSHRNKK